MAVQTDEWMDLALMGIGAGAKGLVTGLVEKFLPGVGPEIGGIIAGGLLYYYGDQLGDWAQKIGAGVLIASIGGFTEGWFEGITLFGGSPSPGSSSSEGTVSSEVTSLEAIAQMEAQKAVPTAIM